MPQTSFEVAVVGAGPGGASCAYYLARQGLRVLLLERKAFPRDKFCGDAVVPRAQAHLQEMGVLDELVTHGEGHFAAAGGFISPSGVECLGSSKGNPHGLVMAVKRLHLDARIAWAARRAGAELVEGADVRSAELDRDGSWTLRSADGASWRSRVLVAADGAHSQLAHSLGVVTDPPDAICSRAYIEGGTHDFAMDGVCYMPEWLLPGYAATFRHPNDELNFCCYIIPGGACHPKELRQRHQELLERDPSVKKHLGPRYRIERMKGAWLRLGGVARSYADNLLLVGDAAGQIDPLTGEGIQFAMDGARCASDTIGEAFAAGDFGERFLSRYQARWMKSFGRDFRISRLARTIMARYPRTLDAMARATLERGDDFLRNWADVMTGSRSWNLFLRPSVFVPIARELWRHT